MKALTLTSTLIAALSLSAFGQSDGTLRSQISLKEKELAELQKEIASLKSRLGSGSTSSASSYTVKTGDTLSSIARRHKVTTSDLMSWNKITDPTKLGIGEVLTIKGTGTVQATKTVAVDAPKDVSNYTIKKGDTFYSIARTHKMTVTQLRELNPEVSTHLITAGQTLRVAGKAAPTVAKSTPKPAPKETPKPASKKVEVKTAKVTPPAPKKEKTPTIATKSSKNSSTPTPVANKPEPKSEPKSEPVAMAKKDLPSPPEIEDKPTATKASVTSIILTDETTFDAFAAKHGTNTEQLNALNGWNLPKATVLARGSEIYVPQ